MDRHLIADPSLSSLDVVDMKFHNTHHINTTGYINDLCSPVSDTVTTGHHRGLLHYNPHRTDTIVLSPGAIFKSTSSPSGMQRAQTHETILIPFPSKVSDDFMYSLEHVLWRQLPAVTWPVIDNVDILLSPSLPAEQQQHSDTSTLNPPSYAATPLQIRREVMSSSTQTEIYKYSKIDLRNADSIGDDIAFIDESATTSKCSSNRTSKFINDNTIYITQECPEYIL